jgi:hypothetical protein
MEAQKKIARGVLSACYFSHFFRAYWRAEDSETSLGIVNSEFSKKMLLFQCCINRKPHRQ